MNTPWFSWKNNTLTLRVYLQPGTKENAVCGLFNHRLKIKIKAPPVAGKANREVIELLSAEFQTSKSHINISNGKLGRNKTIEINSPARLPDWFAVYADTEYREAGAE